MTKLDPNNIYDTPSANLNDPINSKQQHDKTDEEEKRLKGKNIVSAILFVAYGGFLYCLCGKLSFLITKTGKVYVVPMEEVLKAIEPYEKLQISIIPFVIIGLMAYISFIIGNVKVGIFIILFSMITLTAMLYGMNTDLGLSKATLLFIIILAPLILIAFNTVRINYYKTKMIKEVKERNK